MCCREEKETAEACKDKHRSAKVDQLNSSLAAVIALDIAMGEQGAFRTIKYAITFTI